MDGAATSRFPSSKLYDPPIDEFSILATNVKGSAKVSGVSGPSILLITELNGSASVKCKGVTHELVLGSVWFVDANTDLEFNSAGDMICYQAFCEI